MKPITYSILSLFITGLFACQQPSAASPDPEGAPTQLASDETQIESGVTFDSAAYTWKDGYIQLDWKDISNVEFKEGFINDTLAMIPVFHDSIRILENKLVQIKGYLIEFGEKTGKLHFISAYPMSQCFFCGAAGPETVMDVMTQKVHKGFRTDDILTFRGKLHLNDSNLDYMNFILREAEYVGKG